jgi:MSHA type pilus biogenesis protein MshL
VSRRPLLHLLSALALQLSLGLSAQAPAGGLVSITVGTADLRDVLRAATANTDLNLIFDPGLDTRVEGLNLKGMSLDEILEGVLPRLGLRCTREGRNLLIQKNDAGVRFYHVDQQALSRSGTKSYQVNSSGQGVQTGKGASGGGASSSYTSSIQVGYANDPWVDLESGLMLLVFGKQADKQTNSSSGTAASPGSRGHAADGKSLLIQPATGVVVVDADPATHKRVETYLKEIQKRSRRQVQLEARIVEVTLDDGSETGVDWSKAFSRGMTGFGGEFVSGEQALKDMSPTGGILKLTGSFKGLDLNMALKAMARDKNVKVLSTPRISTLNNQKAILRVVQEQPYALISSEVVPGSNGSAPVAVTKMEPLILPVGIVLDNLPQVADDGLITMAVNPTISESVGTETFTLPASSGSPGAVMTLPRVDRRDLDTVVSIRSGETLVLAGIIRNREVDDKKGVPWLRKIPILGGLFRSKAKGQVRNELAIFITPTLVEETDQIQAQRKSAEDGLEKLQAEAARALPKP